MASKHTDCTCEEEGLGEVRRLINKGVAIDGFFDMMGGISSDVTTGGLASLDNRGLRTWEKFVRSTLGRDDGKTHPLFRE